MALPSVFVCKIYAVKSTTCTLGWVGVVDDRVGFEIAVLPRSIPGLESRTGLIRELDINSQAEFALPPYWEQWPLSHVRQVSKFGSV